MRFSPNFHKMIIVLSALAGKHPDRYTCRDERRAYDFDANFECQCTSSWEGIYCEDDYNECNHGNPCPEPQLCTNTMGGYQCYCDGFFCNIGLQSWEFALIIVFCLLFLAALVVIILWGYKRYREKQRRDPYWNHPMSENMKNVLRQPKILRPSSADSRVHPLMDDDSEDDDTPPPMHLFTKWNKNDEHVAMTKLQIQYQPGTMPPPHHHSPPNEASHLTTMPKVSVSDC